MSAPIDSATVDHVARLARLTLSEEERVRFTGQLRHILGYFGRLQDLDLSAVEPTPHVPAESVLREDVSRPSLDRTEVMAAAPAEEEGFFQVPPVLEPA